MFSYELICRRCQWRTVCGREDAIARLRVIGLLRREPDPDDALLVELFVDSAPRMTCPVCKEKSLSATPCAIEDEEDWQAAVLCEVCGKPIPIERLEAIPAAKRCAQCQERTESGGADQSEPDFCAKCGAPVEIRVSRGAGITRYKRVCTALPPCRL